MEFTKIACMKCKHYMVTFDPSAPRGCKLYDFKGATMPYVMVKHATGRDCEHFEERTKKTIEEAKVNFNDDKYWK